MRCVEAAASTFAMPTVEEQLAAATSTLDALMSAATPAPEQLSAVEVVGKIAAELKGEVTKERAEYLSQVLDALTKNNWEATSFIGIKVINDPMQIKPETASIAPLQTLSTGKPDSLFATNLRTAKDEIGKLTTAKKAELITALLTSQREVLQKSKLTDKLGEIKDLFSLSDDDMNDGYEIRWKVGDLISALLQAIKLENLVEGSSTSKQDEPAPAATSKNEAAWPNDMAAAKFDPVEKSYKREEPAWGYDKAAKSAAASRR